jgi:two-component system nitrate/nitrite sensor histidine kinase NarX
MDARAGLGNLRHLRWIGVVAPVIFLLALEAARLAILDPAFGAETANVLAAALAATAAVGFGLVLFFHIELAQREIVNQNRDLGAVKAVSIAIEGQVEVEPAMEAALAALADSTGAARATVHVPAREPGEAPDLKVVHEPPGRVPTDGLSAPERTVEVPLDTGSPSPGHLRISVPAAAAQRLPSAAALQTVGNQVAAAIQIGQLIADLRRRQDENQTLYQTLLQISNQAPLSEIIATIVRGARERLAADDGRMCMSQALCTDLHGQHEIAVAIEQGLACQCASPGDDPDLMRDPCPTSAGGEEARIHASIWTPGERFGELWIARHAGQPFNRHDRAYLATLAGLAGIAIASARLREKERQGATLAERDRIARELHDSLAQVLATIHLRLQGLLGREDLAERPRIAAEISELAGVAEEAYRDVREAILGLREASRTRGLIEGLAAYLDKYSRQSGIRAELDTAAEGELPLTADAELQVIRVIQEALTNVRKHARATCARIRIAVQPGGILAIVIEDDGRGFDPARVGPVRNGGFGVQTMRERVELVGGSLRIESGPGRGSRVIAMVPLAVAATAPAGARHTGEEAGA